MKLWGGRFKKGTDALVNDFNSSINVDSRMYKEDIEGSLAHVKMLGKQGIIPNKSSKKIEDGLNEILKRLDNGVIEIDPTSEDIHSFVEGTLTYYIGACGKMLHTGRSRNDQVTLDLRLYLKKALDNIVSCVIELEEVIHKKASKNMETIMPGYTHMQKAQPITLAHHLLAYGEMLRRDIGRLQDAYKRTDQMPLGSGALATSTYPIDREFVAKELRFSDVTWNSLDSVSDRDYVIETLSALSIIMMHLSRFSEEIILWCTNAYNKDMQEDKEALFDALDTVTLSLKTFTGMLDTMKVKKDVMRKGAAGGFTNATDVADYLVKHGIAFRNAHEIVGEIVIYCINKNKAIDELSLNELKSFSPIFEEDIYNAIDLLTCVEERQVIGGPSTKSVKIQLDRLAKFIKEIKGGL